MDPLVEVSVARLGLDGSTNTYVVILREKEGERILPIWIGQPEAESIAMEINQIKRERPVTHDLCRNIILALGGTLRRVQITKVQKSTYYAELLVQHADGLKSIDARPSDSIAIALRLAAPIFADESLLTVVSGGDDDDDTPSAADAAARESELRAGEAALDAEQLKAYLENLRPEDFGKFNM